MYCSKCGTQIPNEANFCWNCGATQKSGAKADEKPDQTKWEMCEIVREEAVPSNWSESFSNALFAMIMNPDKNERRFEKYSAKAIGTARMYIAGEVTEKFDKGERDSRKAVQSVEALATKLAKDGWDPMGKGEQWYNYRFRRRVK